MTTQNYPATSPYHLTSVINEKSLDLMNNRQIPKLSSDRYWEITAVYNMRPDLLAFDLYGDAKLWWVFANRNTNVLLDPLFDFVPGVSIFLPLSTTLQQSLGI